jgi:SAM-dependent methyltransferase
MEEWPLAAACSLWRCRNCGHVQRDLDRCNAGARTHPWGGSRGFDRIRTALTMRRLRQVVPRAGRLDVLEVGFGGGELLCGFLRAGHRVTGIDPGLLETDVGPELRAGATLYLESAESVALPERAFDVIYGIHVAEHLDDPAAVFAACRRALREDGALYLMTPNGASKGLTVFREAWWNLEDPTHVRFFSPRSVGTMLRGAGFDRVRIRTPIWDSLTLEISSALRTLRRGPTEHGVLSDGWAVPIYGLLLPAAFAARLVWPGLAPSMEILAHRAGR